MTRYAIRNIAGPYDGEWFTLERLTTRAEYEAWRLTLSNPAAFEVVQVDDDGLVTPCP